MRKLPGNNRQGYNYNPKYDTVPRGLGTIVGTVAGFPRTLKFKHKFVQNTTTVGSGEQYRRYRANGMYDPDQTGAGAQPLYFDQLATIYNHYTVVASKITVASTPLSQTTEDAYQVVLWINDDFTKTPNFNSVLEQQGSQSRLCNAQNPGTTYMSTSWSLWNRFRGRTGDSRFTGNSGADPSEQTGFEIIVRALDGGVSSVSVYHVVTIEYTAVWTELKDIAGS